MAGTGITIKSNLDLVLQATDAQIRRALEDCGLDAEKFAKRVPRMRGGDPVKYSVVPKIW